MKVGSGLKRRQDTLIDIEDVEEANLSEYNGSTPVKVSVDRYSDLRGSQSGSRVSGRRNSDNLVPTNNQNMAFKVAADV